MDMQLDRQLYGQLAGQLRIRMRYLISISCLLALIATSAGCTTKYLLVRDNPFNPLANALKINDNGGAQATDRTSQILRRYDLVKLWKSSPDDTLSQLHHAMTDDASSEMVYAYAELSYIRALKIDSKKESAKALHLYGDAVAHSYYYLFDPFYQSSRNPYDPQFRRACNLYNSALEGAMRIVNSQGKLRPGVKQTIQVGDDKVPLQVVIRGPWKEEEIDRLEFVSEYEINGLNNKYEAFGLGVPMIAVRKCDETCDPAARYYPPGLSFPMTAFLRVHHRETKSGGHAPFCTLELHDPLQSGAVQVANDRVPLQMDASTPLAYFIDSPDFEDSDLATWGLVAPGSTKKYQGIYMMEAYDPKKIPVLFVHGVWSSPKTWTQMYNDLRSLPEIRNNYQFWTYLYPTGQPFWISATQMRKDLADLRSHIDPQQRSRGLDQMVLVGHSMGGLVSRMQSVDSGNDFWSLMSENRFDELKADDETKERLRQTVFFKANPGIRRVVTLGTPYQGSDYANDYTRYLGRKLIALPQMLTSTTQRVTRDNPGFFRSKDLLTMNTSIDSLAPNSPVLSALSNARKPPWIKFHNVVGVVGENQLKGEIAKGGDGIVDYSSAHRTDVHSEIVVDADHVTVHQHPRSILEVRRVLLEHLGETVALWNSSPQVLPTSHNSQIDRPSNAWPNPVPWQVAPIQHSPLPVGPPQYMEAH